MDVCILNIYYICMHLSLQVCVYFVDIWQTCVVSLLWRSIWVCTCQLDVHACALRCVSLSVRTSLCACLCVCVCVCVLKRMCACLCVWECRTRGIVMSEIKPQNCSEN